MHPFINHLAMKRFDLQYYPEYCSHYVGTGTGTVKEKNVKIVLIEVC